MRPLRESFSLPRSLLVFQGETWEKVKNPPASAEGLDLILGQEDPLEKGMATTPVFLPGESHGQKSWVGYSPWVHGESDMTE